MDKEKFWGYILAQLSEHAYSPEEVCKLITIVMTALDYATEEAENGPE